MRHLVMRSLAKRLSDDLFLRFVAAGCRSLPRRPFTARTNQALASCARVIQTLGVAASSEPRRIVGPRKRITTVRRSRGAVRPGQWGNRWFSRRAREISFSRRIVPGHPGSSDRIFFYSAPLCANLALCIQPVNFQFLFRSTFPFCCSVSVRCVFAGSSFTNKK